MADEFYDPKPWERPLAKPLSLPASNTDRTSDPKGHWEDGGKVWVEDHDCALPVSNTGEWQPIETAPKDRKILTYGKRTNGGDYQEVQKIYDNTVTGRLIWPITWMHGYEAPTHWQPLPEAPK